MLYDNLFGICPQNDLTITGLCTSFIKYVSI